jgi:RNA polymerase sigma factor (sigma-70 family)
MNVAYRQLQRLESVFSSLASPAGKQSPIFTTFTPDPESCLRDREVRAILQKTLGKLPRRYQLIFLMKEVRNIETPEIARRLQIRQSNVRLQLHGARRLLRKIIDHGCQ